MSLNKQVFVGKFLWCDTIKELRVLDGYLVVEDGKITKRGPLQEFSSLSETIKHYEVIKLSENQILIPGFVDCHTHAPQFPNIGVGLDRPLLEWLDKYTFPLEKQYSDESFADAVYKQVVSRLLRNGTTTACYFGTLSVKGTLRLAANVHSLGQRALVGKVSMNMENCAGYYKTTQREIEGTEAFVKKVVDLKSDLVSPIVTPRFALSCDAELMSGLAEIADKYDCRIQSHISENKNEIQSVLKMFPGTKSYSEVYDKSKILNSKCIMAHAVHLSDEEMKLLSQRGVSIAHCPASNTRLLSGLCPVRRIMDYGITVGLGTDVSGGDSATIMDAMRRAMDVSAHLQLVGKESAINWKEAFYLATLGGAKALNLSDKIGNFEVGKDFDALLIDVYATGGAIDQYEYSIDNSEIEVAHSLLQRFIFLGDDRNILKVYVKGKQVKRN